MLFFICDFMSLICTYVWK